MQKLMILGYKRHGKTYTAEYLSSKIGIKYEDSSLFAAKHFIFDKLKDEMGYNSVEECHADRVNHRQLWYILIKDYNKDDKAQLAKDMYKHSDCYVGLRSKDELEIIKRDINPLCIWIDASQRKPIEDKTSCTVHPYMADLVIENNSTLKSLNDKLDKICNFIKGCNGTI